MSIQEISEKTHISASTISRLPKHLGFSNLKELKQYILKSNENPASKLTYSLNQNDSIIQFLKYQNQCIEKTMEYLDLNTFNKAIINIVNAKEIYIFAKGATIGLAELLQFRLNRYSKKISILPSSGSEIFEILPKIKKEDLVIIFAFSKTPIEAQVLIDYCKKTKCPTLMFTSRIHNNEELQADDNIFIYRGESKEYHSMTAATALIDAIIIEVAKVGGDDYIKHIKEIYHLKEEYKTKIQR
ncbi:MAG: MurR/RpiR family transcriptional regulator [Bacilli bacterium]|nr:MurR/RpiR family transcriptional regulator [Bacilli bacterium]